MFRWVLVALWPRRSRICPGLFRSLSADREATYQGLKIFSDVIDIVEKNYVDEVDPKTSSKMPSRAWSAAWIRTLPCSLPKRSRNLQIDTQGEFTGIGIHVDHEGQPGHGDRSHRGHTGL